MKDLLDKIAKLIEENDILKEENKKLKEDNDSLNKIVNHLKEYCRSLEHIISFTSINNLKYYENEKGELITSLDVNKNLNITVTERRNVK